MAAFTSVGSGNWNAVATWGGANYPGDTALQDDTVTIAAGHTVSLNLTTLTGTVSTVTVAATGKLTVDANFNTASKLVGAWSISGELEFNKTGITTALDITGNVTTNSGGTLDMDASAASCQQNLGIRCASAWQYKLTDSAGATIVRKGRPKTHRTLTNGALTKDVTTTLHIDDDTGWEAGDSVAIAHRSYQEELVLVAKVDDHWTFTGGGAGGNTPKYTHADNTSIWNLSRSVKIFAANPSYGTSVSLGQGTGCTNEWWGTNDASVTMNATGITLTGVVAWMTIYAAQAFNEVENTANTNLLLDKCIAWSKTNLYCLYFEGHSNPMFSGNRRVRDCCFCNGAGAAATVWGLTFSGCHLSGAPEINSYFDAGRRGGHCDWIDCYLWGGDRAMVGGGDMAFTGCVFGQDPGGNAAAHSDADFYRPYGPLRLYDCLLASGTEVSTNTTDCDLISCNHDNVSGARKEWQDYGTIATNTVEARTGNCDLIDPSSATFPAKYRIVFPCDTGKTPSLTFYAKGGGTLGNLTVKLGPRRCGITAITPSSGSLDADCRFTVTGTYAQKTVNFTTATDCAGEVEVVIEILDSASGLLYVDDIAVTGNL
jgi:hypothetical protein